MSEHAIRLEWASAPHATKAGTYNRDHKAVISPEVAIPVSAAPEYLGNPNFADPEQMLVSALASCHMLFFLAICEGSGYSVETYVDEAVGTISKSPEDYHWVSTITLRPRVTFSGDKQPDRNTLTRLHDKAHKGCFIANSIKSEFVLELD